MTKAIKEISAVEDGRVGLGYGTIEPRFNKPWLTQSTFPFDEPDEYDDINTAYSDEDVEAGEAVSQKIINFQRSDPFSFKGTDPLYFVGAATNLRACFERPDDVLAEVEAAERSILAVPGMYGRGVGGPAIGGFSTSKALDQRSAKKTGTKKGWSKAPPLSKVAEDDLEEEEFYNLRGLYVLQRPKLGECLRWVNHT